MRPHHPMTWDVLFLLSDTGGGHRASARAIGEALQRLGGDSVHCTLTDLFALHGPWPLNQIPHIYAPLVTHHVWLWRLLWRAGAQPWLWRLTTRLMMAWNRQRLQHLFEEHPADLVVSVHPLLNHVPLQALREPSWRPATPFATVVTDLATAPPIWYNPAVDLLCASCREVQQAALASGVPGDRIRLTGLPISLRYLQPPGERFELRQRLSLLQLPTVLVMGGGDGMGPLAAIVEALASALAGRPAQIVVICGRNQRLRQQLTHQTWPVALQALGFVANVWEWMDAADCLVTKAGPGAIAEAMARGLPLALSGFVPGQEEGNVRYVVEQGVGAYQPQPDELARLVRAWLEPGNPALAGMAQRGRQLAQPRAALEVAQALMELLPGAPAASLPV